MSAKPHSRFVRWLLDLLRTGSEERTMTYHEQRARHEAPSVWRRLVGRLTRRS